MNYEKLKLDVFSTSEAFCATGSSAGVPYVHCSTGSTVTGADCISTGSSADERVACSTGGGVSNYASCASGTFVSSFRECTTGSGF